MADVDPHCARAAFDGGVQPLQFAARPFGPGLLQLKPGVVPTPMPPLFDRPAKVAWKSPSEGSLTGIILTALGALMLLAAHSFTTSTTAKSSTWV